MEEVGGCLEEEVEENHCETLLMCIITTLNEGLRNGGGIGDILRKPSQTVRCLLNVSLSFILTGGVLRVSSLTAFKQFFM